MMDIKMTLSLALVLSLVLIVSSYASIIQGSDLNIGIGKNKIIFENIETIPVTSFIAMNPDIEVISFVENNKTLGYANIFDGVGHNFDIICGVEYEIISSKEIKLRLPIK